MDVCIQRREKILALKGLKILCVTVFIFVYYYSYSIESIESLLTMSACPRGLPTPGESTAGRRSSLKKTYKIFIIRKQTRKREMICSEKEVKTLEFLFFGKIQV